MGRGVHKGERTIFKSIRYPENLLAQYVQISKLSGIPKDKLVIRAMRRYLVSLKQQYPDYKYVQLISGGRDERE